MGLRLLQPVRPELHDTHIKLFCFLSAGEHETAGWQPEFSVAYSGGWGHAHTPFDQNWAGNAG